MNQLVHYFVNGGPLMWPILMCSILAWAIIIERLIRLRRVKLMDEYLVPEVCGRLKKGDLDGAHEFSKAHKILIGNVIKIGLDDFKYTQANFESALKGSAERCLQALWKNMGALNTVARVATLLGLLGTVVGMVSGFEELTQAGVAKEKLAAAIGIALTTTVGGLCVAIPAIIGESMLCGKIQTITSEFEIRLMEVVKAAGMGGCDVKKAHKQTDEPATAVARVEAEFAKAGPSVKPNESELDQALVKPELVKGASA